MGVTFLSSKMIIAATAIAFGETHKHAANLANVTPGTVSEWMHNPAFGAKINETQLEHLITAQNKFRGLAMSAVHTLAEILAESKSEKAKLDAAKYILDTIQISPAKEGGLWWVGPTTAEELESKEHVEAMTKRLKEIQNELNIPFG